MAKSSSDYTLRVVSDYRPAYVRQKDGSQEKVLFHMWFITGGELSAVVEYDSGLVAKVKPKFVMFADTRGKMSKYTWD